MLNFDPETNVGFLLHDVSRLMRAWFDERARALGLTRAQWRVLVHVGPREGINQTALAEILEIETVTLGRHIDRLERDGWLERRRDPDDRRAWRLHLLEPARPIMEKMQALAAATQETALQDLSAEERAVFVRTLIKMKSNIVAASAPEQTLPHSAPMKARSGE